MKNPVRLGPLALIFTMITMCLSVLAILTFTTARADLRVAEKYAQTVQNNYALEAQGQRYLQTALQQTPDEDGIIRAQFTQNETDLNIELLPQDDGTAQILSWRIQHQWEQETTIGGLWSGNLQ